MIICAINFIFRIHTGLFCCYALLLSSQFCILHASIPLFIPKIVRRIPHELPAFTQGLAIDGNFIYESTGLYGQSSLRRYELSSGKILQKVMLPSQYFAEGIAIFTNEIFQLTWKEQRAFVYNVHSLQVKRELPFSGAGWGLCREGNTFWMSDGSAILTRRDVQTFAPLDTLLVKYQEIPIKGLNDLECVGNHLYANVFGQNRLLQIDKRTGEVTGIIDASNLLLPQETALLGKEDVLNGIAFLPSTHTFLITGKNWPWIFEVSFENNKKF